MNCPRCGHESQGAYCGKCGTQMPRLEQSPPTEMAGDPAATSSLRAEDIRALHERALEPAGTASSVPPYPPSPVSPWPSTVTPLPATSGSIPIGRNRTWRYWTGRGLGGIVGVVLVLKVIIAVVGAAGSIVGSSGSSSLDGRIQFGARYSEAGNHFDIHGTKGTFGPKDSVAWVAHLSSITDPAKIRERFVLLLPTGQRKILINVPVHLSGNQNRVDEIANQTSVSNLKSYGLVAPGTYRLAYYDGSTVLAQGTFTFVTPVDGKVIFGTALDKNDDVVTPKSTFSSRDNFDFESDFNQPASARKITRAYYRIEPNGSKKLVTKYSIKVGPTWTAIYDKWHRSGLEADGIKQPGTYLMAYYRGKTLLAQGKFTLTS